MPFTKHTGTDQPIEEAEIVKPDVIEEAKRKQAKTASISLLDSVNRVEDEDEEETP